MVVLTDRDLDLLRWVNGFGFVSIEQVGRFWGVSYEMGRRRIGQLVGGGFLVRETVLGGKEFVHRVSNLGVKVAGDDLVPMKKVSLGGFVHDSALPDLAMKLEAENVGSVFKPERRLRRERGLSGVGNKGHISDGLLCFEDGRKPVAVELELSTKANARLRKIIKEHSMNLDVSAVWYFVNSAARGGVERAIDGDDFFKVIDWQ